MINPAFRILNVLLVMLFITTLALNYEPALHADQPPASQFPVAPHSNVTIEWWYLNAHVTTAKGRHLALIASFFRFGNAESAARITKANQSRDPMGLLSHYLIYAITDEDAKTHVAYSLADEHTLQLMQQLLTLRMMQNPSDQEMQSLLAQLNKGQFPGETKLISGKSGVVANPFRCVYGDAGSVTAVPGTPNQFRLKLGKQIDLVFAGRRLPMYVGGTGNTGVVRPDDMKYISLTRCAVTGAIGKGILADSVANGEGWFDHQWGNTWTTTSVGWDWWGVQLDDGRDILFFRQRHMSDGSIFQPLATFETPNGNLTVTKNISFVPDKSFNWTSQKTHVTYPLGWTVTFPDQNLVLKITPVMNDQGMPVIASGGAIWEGDCNVVGTKLNQGDTMDKPITGKAYQELVGYSSPIVAKQIQ